MPLSPRLVLLGKQGAGKGTQCAELARHFVIPHISTGDMFRATMQSESELGMRVRDVVNRGDLVSDALTVEIVDGRLQQDQTLERGFVLDGFPRNVTQAKALEGLLVEHPLDLVIDLELPTEVAVQRLTSRRVCLGCQKIYAASDLAAQARLCDVCGGEVVQREDDNEESIRRRLELYESQTAPLTGWYRDRGLLRSVDGDGELGEITKRLVLAIESDVRR